MCPPWPASLPNPWRWRWARRPGTAWWRRNRTPAGSRFRVIRLTAAGARAKRAYHELAGGIEDRWRDRFGASRAAVLRGALERLAVGDPPPLFGGLAPYPGGWRARVPPPSALPHYPMTLHRGGYPDGS